MQFNKNFRSHFKDENSRDLKSEHLNSGNIKIVNFYLFVDQMVGYSDAQYHGTRHLNSGPIFKWLSEYHSVN